MLEYENYIFDLYGTLIDIETDENEPEFWEFMAEIYSCYGADYTGRELQNSYLNMVHEEETNLSCISGSGFPEIKLENVFARLLLEARKMHDTENTMVDKSLDEVKKSEWVKLIANVFRVRSRKNLKVYPGVVETLEYIRDNGGKIYLLSNAQAVFSVPEIEIMGLKQYFDGIYISSDKGIKKPQKEFMEKLLTEYGLEKCHSVMIGNDIESDICVAVKAGLKSIYLNTYDMDESEIEMHMVHVMRDMDEKLTPRIINDGNIRKILN
jgi:putative hydrolase of the HAD superfamily